MWPAARMVGRNRRVISLFVLMVLLPACVFSVLIVRAARTERVREAYERTQRQQQIVRLAESDLNSWLFARHPAAAVSRALLRFTITDDRIAFPDHDLSLPFAGAPRQRPFAATPDGVPLTAEAVTSQYYPRIQAFLRDLDAGRNQGAQYFLRLKAIVVRPPGSDEGYVLHVEEALTHMNARLAEFCAAESFTGTVWTRNVEERSTPSPAGFAFEGFPFFQVILEEVETAGVTGLRRNAFTWSMGALVLVTLLGSLFMYRAVSHEVRLSRLRSDFVSAVSHEFRSPLSSILALSERLESSRVTNRDTLSQYHQMIGGDARRLRALVTRLLDFAQIEEGKRVYALDRVDLVEVAREAIASCQHDVRPERIALLGQDAAPLWVRADRGALQHGLQNLIDNAAKYSAADAPITVACRRANGSVLVEVQDCGIGIPLQEQGRIFEKFDRGRQTSELNVQGVGIGLALVKHVADSHGGSIDVTSEPGRGSTFQLRIPGEEG